MIKQDWMIIVAGHDLVDAMETEQKATCRFTGFGYNSDDLSVLQGEQSRRGIRGVEIVGCIGGYSVRYDSSLQNFGLLATSRDLGGTLESAEQFARNWVGQDTARRYAWRRKDRAERAA
jgi:hypothetical protein